MLDSAKTNQLLSQILIQLTLTNKMLEKVLQQGAPLDVRYTPPYTIT